MLDRVNSKKYYECLAAGYKQEQIFECPLGDPCPCNVRGYVKECGMTGDWDGRLEGKSESR